MLHFAMLHALLAARPSHSDVSLLLCALSFAQFPWVALANCGEKFLDGISLKDQADSLGVGRLTKQLTKKQAKVPKVSKRL